MVNQRGLVLLLAAVLLTLHLSSVVAQTGEDTPSEQMTRIMMLPPDAEVTGMHVNANGHFFVNAMHPDEERFKATVGVINGVDWNNLPAAVPELDSSSHPDDVWHGIRTSYGTYQVLIQSGDVLADGSVAGGVYAVDDGALLFTSQKPDYNAFVPVNDDGKHGFLYTAWEDRPAAVSQLELEWNDAAESWDIIDSQMLNLSGMNGGWVLCFGSVSPWGSPLLSEELYFDDTEHWNDQGFRYHSDQAKLADYLGTYPNPYDYGYIIEIENAASPEPEFQRHLTMGRFSHENAMVMPDDKTVYLTDDGYDTVLFKFIADQPGDLSAGTLFAAHVDQDTGWDSATTGFDVDWIEMASASSAEVQTWIDDYDGITTADFVEGQTSYISDEEINNWAESRLNDDLNNDGSIGTAADDRVAFLESRKAAAALGASDEWNKMEGVAFNPNAPDNLYLAMSSIEKAMTDGQGDIDVSMNSCGIVYRMTMSTLWNVDRIVPAFSGGPYSSSATHGCDIDNLAGPDNLLVLDDGRVLVGEDTWRHEYNMVWLWGEALPEPKDEVISVNHLNTVTTPDEPNAAWTYDYQAQVTDVNAGVSYTAIIVVKNMSDGEWKGLWWWNDIENEGQQHDLTFSLDRGCYVLETSLYEADDLNADAKNATVLSSQQTDMVVGTGTCENGVYAETAVTTNQSEGADNNTKTSDDESLPGFSVGLSILAIFAASKTSSSRRNHRFEKIAQALTK